MELQLQEIEQVDKIQPVVNFWIPADPKDELRLIKLLAEMAQYLLSERGSEPDTRKTQTIGLVVHHKSFEG